MRLSDDASFSSPESAPSAVPGERDLDLFRLTSFLDFETERSPNESSSTNDDMEVAAVDVERDENLIMLSAVPVVVVSVRVDERLIADFERRWLPIDPSFPNTSLSPLDPGNAPNRFLEITSRPNKCARDRELTGVAGREVVCVRNLNKPN